MLDIFKRKNTRIYLDNASITPIDARVLSVLTDAYVTYPANPSSLYKEGVEAQNKLEESRQSVAKQLEVHSDEIYFTSGGTEGNNISILGIIEAFTEKNPGVKPHIVSTVMEHPAILQVLDRLSEKEVCDISLVPIEEDGRISAKAVREVLRPETILVSVMYVNNEIGTVQPIEEIAKALRHFKKEQGRTTHGYPYLHTDACQAAAYCSLRVPSLGVDLLTLDGSKIYGPRGIGAIYIRRGVQITSVFKGGDQENGIRPGTEPLAQIVGFTKALEISRNEYTVGTEAKRIAQLRDDLLSYITETLAKTGIAVQENGERAHKVPNNIHICVEGMDAEFAVLKLDAQGVSVSSVTSCRSKKDDSSSYVVEALERAQGKVQSNVQRVVGQFVGCSKSSLRITLGRFTTRDEIERTKKIIVRVIQSLK